MLAQLTWEADPDKKLGPKSRFTHAPRAPGSSHRMADENVHLSKCPLKLLEMEAAPMLRRFSPSLRRFSITRLIHGIAIKTSSGERLAVAKERFFRAAVSMSEKHNGMRTRRCGEKSKRGRVCSQHYFFDANARLNPM